MSIDDGLLGATPTGDHTATGSEVAGAARSEAASTARTASQETHAARRDAATALERLEHAQDDFEDAEGALSVAQARAAEEAQNPDRIDWERLASWEAVRVAQRVRHRAVSSLVRAELDHDLAETQLDSAIAREPAPGAEPGDLQDGELHFANVYVFVETFLVYVHARYYDPVAGWNWCAQWWEHVEAVSRLEALWQAFEILRLEPGVGPATWWRDYCDPTMAQLTDPSGPFSQCKAGDAPRHQLPNPLPVEAAPGGLA